MFSLDKIQKMAILYLKCTYIYNKKYKNEYTSTYQIT